MPSNSQETSTTFGFRYVNGSPYFDIKLTDDLVNAIEADFRIEIETLLLENKSLQITIHLKSFRSNINFHTIVPYWDKSSYDTYHFLNAICRLDKIEIYLRSTDNTLLFQKLVCLNSTFKEHCKYYLSHFIPYQERADIKTTLEYIPESFLVPYSAKNYFTFLCKIEAIIFNKIKFLSDEDIHLDIKTMKDRITFSLSYSNQSFAFITMGTNEINQEVIDDFNEFLNLDTIEIFIGESSMKEKMFIKFIKPIDSKLKSVVQEFFYNIR